MQYMHTFRSTLPIRHSVESAVKYDMVHAQKTVHVCLLSSWLYAYSVVQLRTCDDTSHSLCLLLLCLHMSQAVPWAGLCLCLLTRLRLMPVPTNANAWEQHKAVSTLASVATTACLAICAQSSSQQSAMYVSHQPAAHVTCMRHHSRQRAAWGSVVCTSDCAASWIMNEKPHLLL